MPASKVSTFCGRHHTVNGERCHGQRENDPESDRSRRVLTRTISRSRKDNCKKNTKPVSSGIQVQHWKVLNGQIIYLDYKEVEKTDSECEKKQKQWRSCHICKTGTTYLSKKGFFAHLRDVHNILDRQRCEREAWRARKLKGNGKSYPLERRLAGEMNPVIQLVAEGAGTVMSQMEDHNMDVDQGVGNQGTSGDFQASELSLPPPGIIVEPSTGTEKRGNGRYNLRPNRTQSHALDKVTSPNISKKKRPSPNGRGRGRPKKLVSKPQQSKNEEKQNEAQKKQAINNRINVRVRVEEEVPPPPSPSETLAEPSIETQAQGRYNLRPNRSRNYTYPANFWSPETEKPEQKQEQKKPKRGRPKKSAQPTPQTKGVANNTMMNPDDGELEVPPRPPKVWCRLCPATVYLHLRDLRRHIVKTHKKDPSMVSWFNTWTWGLPIAGFWKPHAAFCEYDF